MLTDTEITNLSRKMSIPLKGCFFKDDIEYPITYNQVYIVNLQDSETEKGDENDGTHWTMLYIRETPNKTLEPIYFDPYGCPPPEDLKNMVKKQCKKELPFTSKDIQSLMNNACGFYCLAIAHFITASKHRSNDLYNDIDTFLDMFDDLNTSIDWKKNEYILKHFFLSEDPAIRKTVDVFHDHSFYDKITNEDEMGGRDMMKLPVTVNYK